MDFTAFHYKDLQDVRNEMDMLGVKLPLSENIDILKQPLSFGKLTAPNRIAIQPMEGCDGTADGRPDEFTLRRYDRFAKSGAGLIWEEATAIVEEGRANPRQVVLKKENVDSFKAMVEKIKETSLKENGFEPVVICQMTHSGRYSKPTGTPAPLIAYNNPIFEKDNPIPQERIVTDDYLRALEEKFGEAARLAELSGFDGADVKCCHRYLLCETLSGFTRPGEYGGSFENRTRLYLNAIRNAQAATGENFLITSRLNVYDGFPYPYGFGVNAEDGLKFDPTEPIKLVKILHEELGMPLLDITIGNPYVNPHVNRPADHGPYDPPEHPLEGVARMFDCISTVRAAVPGMKIISSSHSYMRQFSPYLAAGAVESGIADMAGFGRMAFAYPDFAKDMLYGNGFDEKKTCIACGKCSELMRMGKVAGCVIRDGGLYLPIYKA
ncbi:MAG: flavin oxidoreductase/NADH oxidase [Clostridia bacterium]|nr:flavin oxidoreductase/NADH oxidase [Clostridia bacterium]